MTPEYIYIHESVYNYLVSYFLPDLSAPCFQQDAAREIEQHERMTYCRYMAAWLPHEPYYEQILKHLNSLSTERSTRQPASASFPLVWFPVCPDAAYRILVDGYGII